MNIWIYIGILTAAALVFSAVGFYEFIWFLSVGYGLAVSGIGLANIVLGFVTGLFDFTNLTAIILLIQSVVLVLYGFRLGGFLLIREVKNAAYKKTLESTGSTNKVPIFVSICIWIPCAILYVGQTAGVSFKLAGAAAYGRDLGSPVLPIIGLVIMILGAGIEALADKQKSAQKKEDPKMVATKGLFKFTRCPNYFGEVTFWTGTFISGINCYKGGTMWITAIICYIAIVYIMFNGCQRLDKRQSQRLAGNEVFEKYASKTPILIPFIPWFYHMDPKEAIKSAKMEHAEKLAKQYISK